ncbi:hypothetical protein Trydic_g2277, partial [Trypoxylus dichotomus]
GYSIYRTDRPDNQGGGTAILIKNHINYVPLPNARLRNLEATRARISTSHGPLDICSAYLPPSKDITEEDFDQIFGTNNSTVLMGDLNAKHPSWNAKVTNSKGLALQQLAQDGGFLVLRPDEPTHIHTPTGTMDVLDVAVLKNTTASASIEVLHDQYSDHLPIRIFLDYSIHQSGDKISKTNWENYSRNIKIRPITINVAQDIDAMTAQLQKDMLTAIAENTTQVDAKKFQNRKLPEAIKLKLVRKKALTKEYKRTLHPDTKKEHNRVTHEIKEDLPEQLNYEWDKKVERLKAEDFSLWKMTKALINPRCRSNIPPLTTSGRQAISPKEKAEAFANTLSDTFKPNPSNVELQHLHCHIDDKCRTATFTGEETAPATKSEIEALVKILKRKKATGDDSITSEAIKNLPSEGVAAITYIINVILKLGHFPDTWKVAKPPPYISKIAERAILNRLNEATEELGIIPHYQLGFREGHSTTHQLVRLTEHITEKMNISTPTAAIFLDVEKAVDRTLSNKSEVHVVVENEARTVLGSHLFNLYMYDIPTLAHSKVAQLADDTAINLSNRNSVTPCVCKRILTHYCLLPREENSQNTIEGLRIPWSKQAKYLGVVLDESLTYKHHAANIRKKIGASAHALYPLLNPKSRLSLENRIKIVKTIIAPTATYVGEVWHQADSSAKDAVQSKLNNIIRLAARAPRFMSIRLRKELKLPALEETIVKRATQTIAKIHVHKNPLIKECIKDRKPTSKRKWIKMLMNEAERPKPPPAKKAKPNM